MAWARENRNWNVKDSCSCAHEAIDIACQVGIAQGHSGSIMVWVSFRGTVSDLWYVYQLPLIRFAPWTTRMLQVCKGLACATRDLGEREGRPARLKIT
ncbi:hypothetical protein TNCV_2863081 [Trichonephila clavipes]|nr:hypothetical protein TNCV_2863081 [Trichonephila clavipes]